MGGPRRVLIFSYISTSIPQNIHHLSTWQLPTLYESTTSSVSLCCFLCLPRAHSFENYKLCPPSIGVTSSEQRSNPCYVHCPPNDAFKKRWSNKKINKTTTRIHKTHPAHQHEHQSTQPTNKNPHGNHDANSPPDPQARHTSTHPHARSAHPWPAGRSPPRRRTASRHSQEVLHRDADDRAFHERPGRRQWGRRTLSLARDLRRGISRGSSLGGQGDWSRGLPTRSGHPGFPSAP